MQRETGNKTPHTRIQTLIRREGEDQESLGNKVTDESTNTFQHKGREESISWISN